MPIDWRKLLGVEAKSSKDALKKKYRQLALKHHPDKASQGAASENLAKLVATVSSRLFNLINEAHNVLSNDNAVIKWENDPPRRNISAAVLPDIRCTDAQRLGIRIGKSTTPDLGLMIANRY